jgi:hypothetical protein
MPNYLVQFPIAGSVNFSVEADDEDAALEAAKEAVSGDIILKISATSANPKHAPSIEDLTFYEEICSGNVCNVDLSEVQIEED